MGVSREGWSTIWVGIVLAIMAGGLAMILTAVGLDAASQPNAAFWARNGVITILVGVVGLIVGFFILYFTRPKQQSESVSPLRRTWDFLRRIRIVTLLPLESNPVGAAPRRLQAAAPATSPPPYGDDRGREVLEHLRVLFQAYARPAFEAQVALLQRFVGGLGHGSEAIHHHLAILVERAIGEPSRSKCGELSRVLEEAIAADASQVQITFGEFYYQYQAMTTWVIQCSQDDPHFASELAKDDEYQSWLAKDREFLTRLRESIARTGLESLRDAVNGTGWGEGMRRGEPSVHDANKRREAVAKQERVVSTFMREGQTLVDEIRASSEWPSDFPARAQRWRTSTYGWLSLERPDLAEEFLIEGYPVQQTMDGKSLDQSKVANEMDRRLWRLKEIHDKIHAESIATISE
jgi:hypothetical protein